MKIHDETALFLLTKLFRLKLDFVAYTPERVWFPKWSDRIKVFEHYNLIAEKNSQQKMDFSYFQNDFGPAVQDGLLKILVIEKSGNDLNTLRDISSTLPELLIISPEENALEITHTDAGKGNGVVKLCKYLNISPTQVCVFGDWENDRSMFEKAGFSVAMGNASEDLKRYATVTTLGNDQCGFALAVNKYILGDIG